MVWIQEGRCQRISEDRGGFLKGDAVFSFIRRGLLGVPFKLHP